MCVNPKTRQTSNCATPICCDNDTQKTALDPENDKH